METFIWAFIMLGLGIGIGYVLSRRTDPEHAQQFIDKWLPHGPWAIDQDEDGDWFVYQYWGRQPTRRHRVTMPHLELGRQHLSELRTTFLQAVEFALGEPDTRMKLAATVGLRAVIETAGSTVIFATHSERRTKQWARGVAAWLNYVHATDWIER